MTLSRFLFALMIAVCVAALAVGGASSQQRQQQSFIGSASSEQQWERVSYPVAELVIGDDLLEKVRRLPECAAWLTATKDHPPKPTSRTIEEFLIRLITSTIDPQSWSEVGGQGTIKYAPKDWKLIVNQTNANQEKVADLLAAVEGVLNVEVAVETRFVSVSSAFAEFSKKFLDCEQSGGKLNFLDDRQMRGLLESAQGDRRTNVMQAPKLTVFNGQEATINVGDEVTIPSNSNIEPGKRILCGVFCKMLPIVSADRQFVQLNADIVLRNVERLDTPNPNIQCLETKQNIVIPNNGTVVIHMGKTLVQGRNEFGPPLLSRIPYLSRLFTNVGYGHEEQEVFAFITTRVIINDGEPRATRVVAPR